jgi:hypothetical protein
MASSVPTLDAPLAPTADPQGRGDVAAAQLGERLGAAVRNWHLREAAALKAQLEPLGLVDQQTALRHARLAALAGLEPEQVRPYERSDPAAS